MEVLVVWVIAAYGLTNIIVYGSIFEPVRGFLRGTFLGELLSCVMCTSTWVGLLFSIVTGGVVAPFLGLSFFLTKWLADMFFFSGAVWMLNTFVEYFEKD